MRLFINTADLAPGTLTTFSIVNYDTQTLISQEDVYAGNGWTDITAQPLPAGHYYALGEYQSSDPIAGLQGDFVVSATGRLKDDGFGGCYWEPNDSGPNQCYPNGRWKVDGSGGCYWDANDAGPNQCAPAS
jgi:hypothetical protein